MYDQVTKRHFGKVTNQTWGIHVLIYNGVRFGKPATAVPSFWLLPPCALLGGIIVIWSLDPLAERWVMQGADGIRM